jgi:transcriptional regulator with XRE-family HTH domain
MKNEREKRGEWLRDSRLKIGMTQEDLATALGFACGQFVSSAECGHSNISFHLLPLLCETLKIDKKEMINSYVRETEQDLQILFKHVKK